MKILDPAVAADVMSKIEQATEDGTALYEAVDKIIATHNAAQVPCPWLIKARQALSDVGGHLGSHVSDQTAAPAPAKT